MIELIIQGVTVEVEERDFSYNKQANDIGDISTRQGSFTRSWSLPQSKINRELFGFPENINSETNTPYIRLDAVIKIKGREFAKGFVILEETGKDYEITFYDGIPDFFQRVDNKSIRDINMSEYNHELFISSFITFRTATEGLIYTIHDTGAYDEGMATSGVTPRHPDLSVYATEQNRRIVDLNYHPPSYFLHTLFDKIIKEQGYTWSSKTLEGSDDFYDELVLPNNRGRSNPALSDANEVQASFSADDERNITADTLQIFTVETDWVISPNRHMNYRFSGKVRIEDDSTYLGEFNFVHPARLVVQNTDTNQIMSLMEWQEPIEQNGVMVWEQELRIGQHLLPSVNYAVRFQINTENPPRDPSGYTITIKAGSNLSIKKTNGWFYRCMVDAAMNIPEASQSDVLKDVMIRYGLIPDIDERNRHINFFSFRDVINNKYIAKDWSSKFIRDSMVITYQYGDYAQNNIFKWNNENRRRGNFKLNNQNLSEESNVYESAFQTSDNLSFAPGELVRYPLFGYRNWGSNTRGNVYFNEAQPLKIAKLKRANWRVRVLMRYSFNFDQTEFSETGASLESNLPFAVNDGLTLQDYVDEYYVEWKEIIDQVKVIEADFNLTELDVQETEFKIPIFIKQLSSYFYVNIIEDFTPDKPTKVRLIKLP